MRRITISSKNELVTIEYIYSNKKVKYLHFKEGRLLFYHVKMLHLVIKIETKDLSVHNFSLFSSFFFWKVRLLN